MSSPGNRQDLHKVALRVPGDAHDVIRPRYGRRLLRAGGVGPGVLAAVLLVHHVEDGEHRRGAGARGSLSRVVRFVDNRRIQSRQDRPGENSIHAQIDWCGARQQADRKSYDVKRIGLVREVSGHVYRGHNCCILAGYTGDSFGQFVEIPGNAAIGLPAEDLMIIRNAHSHESPCVAATLSIREQQRVMRRDSAAVPSSYSHDAPSPAAARRPAVA